MVDYPANYNPNQPTELVIYATPNGANVDHAFKANLIGSQTSQLRQSEAYSGKNLVVAYLSPDTRKWPTYLASVQNGAFPLLNATREHVNSKLNPQSLSLSIEGFSGGGSFAFSLLNNLKELPPDIHQINMYDAIYAYAGIMHAVKIKNWLESNSSNRLVNITGTPQIESKQTAFIEDLSKLGVKFSQSNGPGNTKVISAYNGRLKFTQIEGYSHEGTIKRNGFSYAHSQEFSLAGKDEASQIYQNLEKIV